MRIYINNVKCKLETGGIENLGNRLMGDLTEYFKEKKENTHFIKNKYAHYNYFLTKAGYLPTGLLPTLLRYMSDEWPDIKLELFDDRTNKIKHDSKPREIGVDNESKLYDYQYAALKACLKNKIKVAGRRLHWPRGIINGATNTGKTYIMAALHEAYNENTLILIHDTKIYRQLYEEFVAWYGKDYVGRVGAGQLDFKPITICMYKTLYNRTKLPDVVETLKAYKLVMVDECEAAAGPTYKKLMDGLQCYARYFFSGTPLDSDSKIRNMKLIGVAGETLFSISNDYLMKAGKSLRPSLIVHDATLSDIHKDEKMSGEEAYERLVINNPIQNQLIVDYCVNNSDRYIMIACRLIKHSKKLFKLLAKKGIKVKLINGEVHNEAALLAKFIDGEFKVMVTTLYEAGMNMPLDTIIDAKAGNSKRSVKQRLGRLVRLKGTTDKPEVIDFFIDHYRLAHKARKRIKIYQEQGLKIKYSYKANRYGTPI